jgi:hypothetical protein
MFLNRRCDETPGLAPGLLFLRAT